MTKQELGSFVKDERMKKKLSQSKLGDLSGIGYQRVLEIEKSKRNYGIESLLAVLSTLGYTMTFNPTGSAGIVNVQFTFNGIKPAKDEEKIKKYFNKKTN